MPATQKTKAKVNRSDTIREILQRNESAKVGEIRAALIRRGIKVSDALINKIKYGHGPKRAHSGDSKADAIRDAFVEMGAHARSRDVIAALAKRGVHVSSAHVSTLRKTLHTRQSPVSLDQLLAAKALVERLGGFTAARRALDALACILGSS